MYEMIKEKSGNMSVLQMCEGLGLCRSGYYRWLSGGVGVDGDLELREEIQSIALEWSAYGYRRITAELRRRGYVINHKRVRRVMREDNLLCLRKKSFMKITNSDHKHLIYPNLAGDLELSGIISGSYIIYSTRSFPIFSYNLSV